MLLSRGQNKKTDKKAIALIQDRNKKMRVENGLRGNIKFIMPYEIEKKNSYR